MPVISMAIMMASSMKMTIALKAPSTGRQIHLPITMVMVVWTLTPKPDDDNDGIVDIDDLCAKGKLGWFQSLRTQRWGWL